MKKKKFFVKATLAVALAIFSSTAAMGQETVKDSTKTSFLEKKWGHCRNAAINFFPLSLLIELNLLTTLIVDCVVIPVHSNYQRHFVGKVLLE